MKRILNNLFLYAMLVTVIGLTQACNDEEEILPGPVVAGDTVMIAASGLISGSGTVSPSLSLNVTAENGLSSIEIFNPDGTSLNTYPFTNAPKTTQQLQYPAGDVTYTDAGNAFGYLVTASDGKGLSSSATVTIMVEDVEASLSLMDGNGNAYLGDSLFAGTPMPFEDIEIGSNYPIDSVSFFFYGHDGVPITSGEFEPSFNTPADASGTFSNNATEYKEAINEQGDAMLPGAVAMVLIRVTSATGVFFEQELRVVGTATSELQEITMGSFDNTNDGSFFSLADTAVYDINYTNQNAGNIDFAYSYGASTGANIFALDDDIANDFFGNNTANWTAIKSTKFMDVANDGLYDAVVVEEDIKAAYDELNQPVSRLASLATGDIFIIKSAEGRFFIAKVTAVADGADGSIQFVLKGNFAD